MSASEDPIETLRKQLRSHHITLRILEEKVAGFTKLEAPVHMIRQREDELAEIERLEAELSKLEAEQDAANVSKPPIDESSRSLEGLQGKIRKAEDRYLYGEDHLKPQRRARLIALLERAADTTANEEQYEETIRLWKQVEKLHQEGRNQVGQRRAAHRIVGFLRRQGDHHRDRGEFRLARIKYVHARDESRQVEDRELEIGVCTDLAHLSEGLGDWENAVDARLDRLDGLIRTGQSREVFEEITRIGRLCRRFQDIELAQSWIQRVHSATAPHFVRAEDVSGLACLKEWANEFHDADLCSILDTAIKALKAVQERREREPKPEERS